MSNKKYKTISILFLISVVTFYCYGCSRESEKEGVNFQPEAPKVKKSNNFLDHDSDYLIPDKIVGFIHKSDAKREYKWEEHERGRIIMKTNNLGFREDKETYETKSENQIRVLVTGDSHIDGVLYNYESFPNLLEDALNSRDRTPRFEIINGGTAYYGPQNYLGFLRKYTFLKPDMFIVVIYTGNDFIDAASFIENGDHWPLNRPKDYYTKLQKCCEQVPQAVPQALNQIFYFKTFPYMMDKVVEFTQKQLLEINALCLFHEIELLVILLPTKLDVEWDSDSHRLEAVTRALDLTDNDLRINRMLTQRLAGWLIQNRISSLDLSTYMDEEQQELFWKTDYHLNVNGHRLIADTLFELFRPSFEQLIVKEKN